MLQPALSSFTHHAGHAGSHSAVPCCDDLPARRRRGGCRAVAYEVAPLLSLESPIRRLYLQAAPADFVAAGNRGAHFLHASVGLSVAFASACSASWRRPAQLWRSSGTAVSFFRSQSGIAKDLHEQGQVRPGSTRVKKSTERPRTMASMYLFGVTLDHGDGQGESSRGRMPDQATHNDNFQSKAAHPSWMGVSASCQPDDGEPDEARTRMATSATRAPSAKRFAISREGSAVAMILFCLGRPMRPKSDTGHEQLNNLPEEVE